MSPRLKKYLRRLVITLVIVFAVVLIGFSWALYWPFEGSVENVVALVPADVDFVYRGSWRGIQGTGWLQKNVFDDPVVAQLRDSETLDVVREKAQALIEDAENQINGSIPGGVATFSVADDIFRGDVLFAGRFCEGSDPKYGLPIVNQWLAYTRVSWKGKFVAGLKHGFVRDMTKPSFTTEEVADGVYKLTLHGLRPSPVRERALCGPGIVRPPENVWYMTRVKDVIVLGNDEPMMLDVRRLADDPDTATSYRDRLDVTQDEGILDHAPNELAVSMDLAPLRHYLIRTIETAGPPTTILQRFLTFNALDRMNGRLVFPSVDMIRGDAEIRYRPSLLADGIEEVYALPPQRIGDSVATLLPAEDTFGALLLKTQPYHLMNAIYEEVLTEGDRQMWRDNLRRLPGGFTDIHDFFREFAGKLDDRAGIAVARMSKWDKIDFATFFDPPDEYPDPNWPAMAFIVRLNSGTKPAELDAYLKERVPLLGGSKELEKKTYKGLPYTRIHLEVQSADYAVMTPAYLLAQDHFVFCSNESYFKKIVETMVDPANHPSLAQDPTFRAVVDQLPDSAHLAFFLDLDKLFRVPDGVAVGSMPRGFLWDRRAIWVRANRNSYDAAVNFRKELIQEIVKAKRRQPTAQEMADINRRVDEFAEDWESRFPEFLEEFRRELQGYARLRAFGLGIRAQRPSLFVKMPFLLKPGGDAATER